MRLEWGQENNKYNSKKRERQLHTSQMPPPSTFAPPPLPNSYAGQYPPQPMLNQGPQRPLMAHEQHPQWTGFSTPLPPMPSYQQPARPPSYSEQYNTLSSQPPSALRPLDPRTSMGGAMSGGPHEGGAPR